MYKVFLEKMGLTDVLERWIPGSALERYQNQGYSLAPFLYYLCSTKEWETFGFSNKSVVELHEQWSNHFTSNSQTLSTEAIIEEWMESHDLHLTSELMDNYYLKLLSGNIVNGVDILSSMPSLKTTKMAEELNSPTTIPGTNYPYGYGIKTIQFLNLKDVSFKEKQLVIKQDTEGMRTYLLTVNRNSENKKYERIGTIAEGKDSIVVSGDKLESFRQKDGNFDQFFFLVTTRVEPKKGADGAKNYNVIVQLIGEETNQNNASTTTLTYPWEGGSQDVTINMDIDKCRSEIAENDKKWIDVYIDKESRTAKVAVQPNLTFNQRKSIIKLLIEVSEVNKNVNI